MGKIKITSDKHRVFKSDTTMNIMDFMKQYFNEMEDKSLVDCLQRIPIPSAVKCKVYGDYYYYRNYWPYLDWRHIQDEW